MDDEEVRKLIATAFTGKDFNSNQKSDDLRSLLEVANNYPALNGLEVGWGLLSKLYTVVEREKHPTETPLESLLYYVDAGVYPPPEILIAIAQCFRTYFGGNGNLSLDECFFGEPHKKTSSPAYIKNKQWSYSTFHDLFVTDSSVEENKSGVKQRNSLEEDGEYYLNHFYGSEYAKIVDLDSFLRGYRRWKESRRKSDTP